MPRRQGLTALPPGLFYYILVKPASPGACRRCAPDLRRLAWLVSVVRLSPT